MQLFPLSAALDGILEISGTYLDLLFSRTELMKEKLLLSIVALQVKRDKYSSPALQALESAVALFEKLDCQSVPKEVFVRIGPYLLSIN